MKNNRFRFIIRPHIVVYGVVTYGYDTYGKLTKIKRGSTEYNLTYNTWNRPLETKVGTTALSTNTYDSYGKLLTVTYANGFSARYEYDNLDRVAKIYQTENNTESLVYEMIYNGEGDLYELRNYRTLRASFFDYDHAGRCMASKERSFTVENGTIGYGNIISSYEYKYDECNNLTKLTCSVASSTWSTTYTYDKDNRPKTTTLSNGKVITNTYDALGRLASRKIGLNSDYITTLTYVPGNETNKTTGLVSAYQNGSDDAYTYTYDDNGNITAITQGTTSITYEYDAANRLTRENNQVTNETVTYEYDTWGNILNRKVYAYTVGDLTNVPYTEIEYEYTNTAWGDQLTSYDNTAITYDSMGNPTSYRGYTFGWRGKQLTTASNGTNSLTFEYNEDGLRQKKTVNNVDTDYFYNGSVLIGMQHNNDVLRFSYDASGSVVSVNYNGTEYYYLRNAQGDIVKLIDASGATVVEYTYDTWGKEVQTTGSLAGTLGTIQPFRYRGYVYDEETGLYYLQSRYYDPEVERFISADVLLSTGQGVLGHNCYAYCNDNPVSRVDPRGTDWEDFVERIESFFGAESRTTYRQRIRNSNNSLYLFIVDLETGFETNIVSNSSGNSSKPVSVYAEARTDDYICSSAGLCFNIGSLSIDFSLGLDNIGVTIGYDRGNRSNWSLGGSLNLMSLEVGAEYKETVQINAYESTSSYVNGSFTLYGLASLYAILNGDYQSANSPAPSYAKGY